MRSTMMMALAFCAASVALVPARAQETPAPGVTQARTEAAPNAADLLFEQPQMKNAAVGSTITYGYLRRSGIAKAPFGPPIEDQIKFTLEAGKDAESRNVRVQMLSGMNRVPAGPFTDMPGNPIIPLFLEYHLKTLARVLEANPRYLKNAIRKGLREKVTVTPTKVAFNGREIDGWRVVTKPFEGDAMTERMRGMSDLTYTFVTASEVPGEVVSIEVRSKNDEGGELLEERVSYDQTAG